MFSNYSDTYIHFIFSVELALTMISLRILFGEFSFAVFFNFFWKIYFSQKSKNFFPEKPMKFQNFTSILFAQTLVKFNILSIKIFKKKILILNFYVPKWEVWTFLNIKFEMKLTFQTGSFDISKKKKNHDSDNTVKWWVLICVFNVNIDSLFHHLFFQQITVNVLLLPIYR